MEKDLPKVMKTVIVVLMIQMDGQKMQTWLTGNMDTLLHPVDVRSLCKTLSFSPGEGQVPLGIYQDRNAEYLSFPTLIVVNHVQKIMTGQLVSIIAVSVNWN